MRLVLPFLLVAVAAMGAPPQGRLPFEAFSTRQGLINDGVTALLSDSRGELWMGTKEGLSRFDGQRFLTYAVADGLPHPYVNAIAEARDGSLYVATLTGIARIDPRAARGRPVFRNLLLHGKSVSVNDVAEDREGRIWSGCYVDLCRVGENGLEVDPGFRAAGGTQVTTLAPDRSSGELWAGTDDGLLRRRADGSWSRAPIQPHRGTDIIHGLWLDRGRLWIGTAFGVFVCAPDVLGGRPLAERITTSYVPGDAFRLPGPGEVAFIRLARAGSSVVHCRTGLRARDGVVWIPTSAGLVRIDERIAQLDERAGLAGEFNAAAEDRAGNLWIGSELDGALRLRPGGVMTYTRADGLRNDRINSIFEPFPGTVCATSGSTRFLQCFENGVMRSAEIIPPGFEFSGWGWGQVVVHDRSGEWWVATGQGVVRWPVLRSPGEFASAKPLAVYDSRNGLGGDDVFRIWQDSRGDLWCGTFGKRVLARRDHITGKFFAYDERDGLPLAAPTAFAEDRAGNVWVGQFAGGIVRYRNGRFEHFTERDGVPAGQIRALLLDRNGALWIATRNAIVRISDPAAAHPVMERVPGLSTSGALSLSEAPDGSIIMGTPHGVELYDARLRPILRLSTTDGLAQNEITAAYADRTGGLWLGTVAGLSYLPHLPTIRTLAPSLPRILSIEAGASTASLAELGAVAVGDLRLRWPDRRMTVVFSAPDFDPRHPLQFEYRLRDDRSWTNGGARRSVTYERLPFGDDRFEVRAVGGDGARSAPATVAFTVVPPFWRTPWFGALVVAALIAAAVALHRVRVAHLLALQRIRTRVATDLHDDLGSSLSRISILSEVARRGSKTADGERVIEEIGSTARTLIDALGDSIWSIDPRRDDVQSLMARLRHFAADVLEAKSIAMQFDVSPALSATPLTPDQRREVFLILKEAINNAAKYSQASRVVVALHVERGHLHASVADDGVGIDRSRRPREDGGHGLPNMRARATRAGGTFRIGANGPGGTRIDLSIPL